MSPITYKISEKVIYRFPYKLVDSNMYFIPSGDTGYVIDPNENKELLQIFKKHGTKTVVIILTHEHYDHTIGVEWLQSKIDSILVCHKACAEAISTEKGNDPKTLGFILTLRDSVDGGSRREKFLATAKHYILHADETFEEECEMVVGGIKMECYPAPGHSPGSAIYIMENVVFTGDSLIQNTPTILKLPGSNKELYNQITKPFLRSLDKKMMVYPGHADPYQISEAQFL